MGHWGGFAVTNEVEGDDAIEVLLDDSLPRVLMAPPVEFITLVILSLLALPLHIHARIVTEFELDGICRLVRMGFPVITVWGIRGKA